MAFGVGPSVQIWRTLFRDADIRAKGLATRACFVCATWKSGMPREADLSLNEREFILHALREDVRVDGRAFDALRNITLTFGDEYGVADVRLGKTRYVTYPSQF